MSFTRAVVSPIVVSVKKTQIFAASVSADIDSKITSAY